MSSQKVPYASPAACNTEFGRGTLGSCRLHRPRGAGHRAGVKPTQGMERGYGQTAEVGAHVNQRFSFSDGGKVHGRKANVPNRALVQTRKRPAMMKRCNSS